MKKETRRSSMAYGYYETSLNAQGHTKPHMPLNRLVQTCIDDETFGEVKRYQLDNKTSLSGAVRELVEIGLETLKMEKEGAE